jgi:hypothetical protein
MILRVVTGHVVQLSERLTYWTQPHPNWRPNPAWPQEVGCAIYSAADALVLFDPLVRDDLSPTAWDWLDSAVAGADGHEHRAYFISDGPQPPHPRDGARRFGGWA